MKEDSYFEHLAHSVDDAITALSNKNVGIKFSREIYDGFIERGIIADHQFGDDDPSIIASPLPAYRAKWPARIDHNSDGWGFIDPWPITSSKGAE